MKKSSTILIAVIILTGLFLFLPFSQNPKKVDWRPIFSTKVKIPMGLYVFNKEIDKLFSTTPVERTDKEINSYFPLPYEALINDNSTSRRQYLMDNFKESMMFINPICPWTDYECAIALDIAAAGNTVFISATGIPDSLQKALNFNVEAYYEYGTGQYPFEEITFTSKVKNVTEDKAVSGSYFYDLDSSHSQILGYVAFNHEYHPNYIRVPYGDGQFLIHTDPAIFTNYFLLKDDHYKYTEYVLSCVPKSKKMVWIPFHNVNKEDVSPLKFIKSQPALNTAWNLLLAFTIIFILFNVRHTQKPIPIIPKNTNTSVEFIKTLSNLYLQESTPNEIILKKITYFLERIRSDYNITTTTLDAHFIQSLHLKSGRSLDLVQDLVRMIKSFSDSHYKGSYEDLSKLNKTIEQFLSTNTNK
ncbi:MAG: hypothetical protein J5I52_01565 [Saprospiraceae bacterium]|nr:MAG: hypothetical protein UZ09_BCD002000123 [Bacteroidetes bacterium OLB9]MCO6462814.1 hypothetical protein [Saprospiraceae bacterium]MCZ2336736.1 hypothetical protein [Chitinophagales bacterium]